MSNRRLTALVLLVSAATALLTLWLERRHSDYALSALLAGVGAVFLLSARYTPDEGFVGRPLWLVMTDKRDAVTASRAFLVMLGIASLLGAGLWLLRVTG